MQYDASEPFREAAILPLGEIVWHNASNYPNEIAFVEDERETTWKDFAGRVRATAAALAGEGLARGSHVGVIGKTRSEMFEVLHACALLGLVFTPLNWRLAKPEVGFVIRDAEIAVLFVAEDATALIDGLCADAPALRRIIGFDGPLKGDVTFEGWRAEPGTLAEAGCVEPQAAVVQLYTSGTTGTPKGAVLTNRYFLNAGRMMADQAEEIYGMRPGEVLMHYFPIFHIGGIGTHYHPALRGCGVILLKDFDPAGIIRIMQERPVPLLMGVPTMLRAFLQIPAFREADFSNIRYCAYGAEPMPAVLRDELQQVAGCRFVQYYGMTESAYVTCLDPADHEGDAPKLLSVGRALPGVEIRIIDESGAVLPAGETGEIAVRSTVMMDRYWKRDDATRAAWMDGWYRSGDGGFLDRDGYLYLRDRIKDMIVSGGENIYPAEIEGRLAEHESVLAAAVVGVEDETWGEVAHAFIIPRPGHTLEPSVLTAFLSERIAKYKLPRSYESIAEFPLNGTGKILKRVLREKARANRIRAAPS